MDESIGGQILDKTNGFRQLDESFGQAFSKACAVEAAEASSRSAEREILLRRFFLRTQTREAICGELASLFSFAPAVSKKKWRKLYNNSGHLEERMV